VSGTKVASLPLIPYIRQSRKKEVSISLDEQRRVIERWASGAGVVLAEAVIEQGVSGSKPWRERELGLTLIHISEPTRPISISFAVLCL
jgi:hypothetical protein